MAAGRRSWGCAPHPLRTLDEPLSNVDVWWRESKMRINMIPELRKPAGTNITSILNEKRVFRPAKEFSKQARIRSLAQYRKLYQQSIRNPEKFWARQAKEK